MKFLRRINLMLIVVLLSACSSDGPIGNLFATDAPLPTASAGITPAPDATAAVTKYLTALQEDDYETMYAMLAQASREAITLEDFSKRWNDALNSMGAAKIEYAINSSQISPYTAEVGYSVTYQTALVGDLQRNILVRMLNEAGE